MGHVVMIMIIKTVLQTKKYVLKVFLKCINRIPYIMMKDILYIKEDHLNKEEILL